MSLFTVLKYGSIDLRLTNEIEEMPEDLVIHYLDEVRKAMNPIDVLPKSLSKSGAAFNISYRMYVYNRNRDMANLEMMQQIFQKVLREYKEPE